MAGGTARRWRSGAIAACLLAPLLALTAAPAASAAPTVTVHGPNVTLMRTGALPAGSSAADVSMARNEFESFQLAVQTSDTAISDLAVDVTGPLANGDGATLPTSAFTFYREAYYTVQDTAGADNRSDGESMVGDWPDALIPQTDYIYGENRSGFSTTVPAGQRVVVWADVLASTTQAPGTYTGTIRVKDGGTVLATVPVSVTVRNFALPSTSTLQSVFPIDPTMQCRAHTGSGNCAGNATKANTLAALYERVALENRLTISTPWAVDRGASLGGQLATWRTLVKPIVKGTAADAALGSAIRLPGAQTTNLSLWWHCGAACIDQWKIDAAADGLLDRMTYYTCDEPGQNADRWTACSNRHAVAQAKGMRELVTAPMKFADENGGGASSWIDDMVVLTRYMAGKDAAWSGNHRPDYTAWTGAAGDGQANNVWLYTSCASAGCDGPSNSGGLWNIPLWNGWAGYAIDQPASQSRAMPWEAFAYDAVGELYWEVGYKLPQAWDDCTTIFGTPGDPSTEDSDCQYYAGMSGDGTLFYPGLACPPANGPGCIGGTKDIPIESIRLKRIRDGREDYEYLHLLDSSADAADRDLADATALDLLGGSLDSATYSATFSQASLEAARDSLGDALDEPVVPPEPTLSISDATVAEGTGGDVTMTFTVTGTGDTNGWVEIKSEDGTATDADYELLTTGLEMHTPETREVEVLISGDDLDEGTETFKLILWNNTNYTLADAEGVGTILDDDGGPVDPTYRPDSLIKTGELFLGDDVYSFDARDQTAKTTVRRRKSASAVWRVQNDGDTPDSYSLVGHPSFPGFITEYYKGKKRITEDVVDGNYSTGVLAPGDQRTYRIVVKATKTAERGDVRRWVMHAVSYQAQLQEENIRDVTALRLKVK